MLEQLEAQSRALVTDIRTTATQVIGDLAVTNGVTFMTQATARHLAESHLTREPGEERVPGQSEPATRTREEAGERTPEAEGQLRHIPEINPETEGMLLEHEHAELRRSRRARARRVRFATAARSASRPVRRRSRCAGWR